MASSSSSHPSTSHRSASACALLWHPSRNTATAAAAANSEARARRISPLPGTTQPYSPNSGPQTHPAAQNLPPTHRPSTSSKRERKASPSHLHSLLPISLLQRRIIGINWNSKLHARVRSRDTVSIAPQKPTAQLQFRILPLCSPNHSTLSQREP